MDDLAELLHTGTPLTVRVGVIVDVTDSTHALVDVGERVIGAAWPRSLGTPVAGVACTLLVGDGVARVISSDQAPPTPVPHRMASGSATLTFSGSSTASVAISFPAGRFTVVPRWVAWLRTAATGVVIATSNETLTEGRINATAFASTSTTVSVGWLAWQMTPTSRD